HPLRLIFYIGDLDHHLVAQALFSFENWLVRIAEPVLVLFLHTYQAFEIGLLSDGMSLLWVAVSNSVALHCHLENASLPSLRLFHCHPGRSKGSPSASDPFGYAATGSAGPVNSCSTQP